MNLLDWIFGNERTQVDKEIDNNLEIINIRLSIQQEAEHNFQIAYGKLTDKQKNIVDKKSEKFTKITGFIFPTRGDYLDSKRYYCEELLEKQGLSKKKVT